MSSEIAAPSEKENLLSDIFLKIFRLNGRLLDHGDHLTAPLGLTSARWQTLGAVAMAGEPLTAPQIAEIMGLTRQGARKQLAVLVEGGFLSRWPNPRHERSLLYELTDQGRRAFLTARQRHGQWADGLTAGLTAQTLKQVALGLSELERRLSGPRPEETDFG